MSLEQILGYNLNGEGNVSITNLKELTLSTAAAGEFNPVRLKEYSEGISAIQTQIDNITGDHTKISTVHVDTTNDNLADALAAGTYDSGANTWTFGDSTIIGEGDAIILQAATDPADRSWIHAGGTDGNASDFERLSSDIQAIVDAGVLSVLNALRDGVPEAGDTLNKLFTLINSVQSAVDSHTTRLDDHDTVIASLSAEVDSKADSYTRSATFAASSTPGVYEATVDNPTGSADAAITVKQDIGGGVKTTVPKTQYLDFSSETQVILRTMSSSMNGVAVDVHIEG